MKEFADFLLLLLTQFAGGPGPKENNLMRFGVPAVFWAALLAIAWSRQRERELPREKLLVWGFALGLARELFMLSHVSMQIIGWGQNQESSSFFAEPLEHALTMAAIVVVAAAFLRYILRDAKLSRRFLQIGLVVTALFYVVIGLWWARHTALNPMSRFNQTGGGFAFHSATSVLSVVAIVLLFRQRGWLRNVVSVAMFFFFLNGFLKLFNFPTDRAYADILCSVSNGFHILAVPVLGYVYLREQSIEKQQAEEALEAYRHQLEDLVDERTIELKEANEQLQWEVAERQRAEIQIAQRNSELAAQNAISATISQTLELDRILNTALDMVLAVLEMDVGSIYLLDADGQTLTLQVHRGDMSVQEIKETAQGTCLCGGVCRQAVNAMKPMALNISELSEEDRSLFIAKENIQMLVSAPLVSKGQALGALTLGSRKPEAVSSQNLDLLAAIGQQIGIAVDNARLYRDTERWAEELALLHEVSVFLTSQLDPGAIYDQINEQTAKLLGCPATAVFLWDAEEQVAVGVSSYGFENGGVEGLRMEIGDNALLDAMMLQRRFVIVEDARDDQRLDGTWPQKFGVRALLGLPLWGKATPLGFLFVIDLQSPRHWQPDELELVESFINLAAIALENARLHTQAERAAALEERQRIAADMHDGLAQVLSYMGLRVDRASELIEIGCDKGALDELVSLRDAVGQASHDVRRSITSLRETPKPRQPLQDWLLVIIAELDINGDSHIHLESGLEEPMFLASDDTEQITRVVQEAVTNAMRHAQADQIVVRLERSGGEMRITVEDNGRGFDPASPPTDGSDHFGLSIMRARAARIGGKVSVESAPGKGTRVVLACPLGPGALNLSAPKSIGRTVDNVS